MQWGVRMYLFSRVARLGTGALRDSMSWAVGQAERVNHITGLDVSLWSTRFSPALGTVAWTTFVPDLATLEAANDKLMVDDEYIDAVDQGAKHVVGGADDRLLQLVYGTPDPNQRPEYVNVVRAVLADGAFVRGMEAGVEIAQRAEKITGRQVAFGMGMTGVYGEVAWISGAADIQEYEAANAALAADTSFAQYLDSIVGTFQQGDLTSQTVYRRLV